jgi:hypothetical protein
MSMRWTEWLKRKLAPRPRDRLYPESLYVVEVDDQSVICRPPEGMPETIFWKDLERVEIHTTDTGPLSCDFVWVLVGGKSHCRIPQGATNEEAFVTKAQALPGFDHEQFSRAVPSTDNHVFVCWTRPC